MQEKPAKIYWGTARSAYSDDEILQMAQQAGTVDIRIVVYAKVPVGNRFSGKGFAWQWRPLSKETGEFRLRLPSFMRAYKALGMLLETVREIGTTKED